MGTLSKHSNRYKSCHVLWLLSPNKYESDLSNEVLYILVGQEAVKILEVKVGGRKLTSDTIAVF